MNQPLMVSRDLLPGWICQTEAGVEVQVGNAANMHCVSYFWKREPRLRTKEKYPDSILKNRVSGNLRCAIPRTIAPLELPVAIGARGVFVT